MKARRVVAYLALSLVLVPALVLSGPGADSARASTELAKCNTGTGGLSGVTSQQAAIAGLMIACMKLTVPGSTLPSASAANVATVATGTSTTNGVIASNVPSAMEKAGGLLSGFTTGWAVGALSLDLVGFDTAGTLCGNDGSGWLAPLYGKSCLGIEAAENFVPNLDVTAKPAGYANTQIRTGCAYTDPETNCYFIAVMSGLAQQQSSTLTLTRVKGTQNQTIGPFYGHCIDPSGDLSTQTAINNASPSSFEFGSISGSAYIHDYVFTCPAGKVLFRVKLGSGAWDASPTLYWFGPLAGSLYPPGMDADPDRVMRCTVLTATGSASADSAVFKETGTGWPAPDCPSVGSMAVTEILLEQCIVGGACFEVSRQTTSQAYRDVTTAQPQCFDGSTECVLDLRVVQGTGTLSCFDRPELCLDWQTKAEPERSQQFRCEYGGQVKALSECYVYAKIFDPVSVAKGEAYADPATGASTGTLTAPMPGSGSAAGETAPCFPAGWGMLNPFEWVVKPVGCALRDAFVPDPMVVTAQMQSLQGKFSTRTVGKLIAAAQVWEFIPPGDGCAGITVNVFFLGPPFQIMGACPGSMLETMAYWSRVFSSLGITVAGVLAISRHVAGIFGYRGLGGNDN